MQNYSPVETLIIKGDKLSESHVLKLKWKKETKKQTPYASIVGSLMYAYICTDLILPTSG